MANRILKFGFTAILAASFTCMAQAPAGAPSGSTGQCKDGTYTSASHKSGACASHGGVQAWFGKQRNKNDQSGHANSRGNGRNTPGNYHGNTGKPSGEEPSAATHNHAGNSGSAAPNVSASANANSINAHSGSAAVVTPNNGGETMPGPAAKSAQSGNSRNHSRAGKEPAPGGGPGMVWVNSQSKVYHCYGSQFYGKTREGKYMTEQEAKKMGAKPDHGKPCSK